jgi:hypothetical protein
MDFSYNSPHSGIHRIRGKFTAPRPGQKMRIVVSVLDFPEPGKVSATGLGLSDAVYANLGGAERKAGIGRALARAAADQALEQLDEGALDGLVHPVTRKDAEWLEEFRHRTCEYQRKGARALISSVARDPRESHVTAPECEQCPLPEYWERCRFLTDVQTHREAADKQRRDLRCAAKCARGEAISNPAMCRPGGRQCFTWGLFTRGRSGVLVVTEETPLRRVPGGPGR